jgi:hypothetical protein
MIKATATAGNIALKATITPALTTARIHGLPNMEKNKLITGTLVINYIKNFRYSAIAVA